MSPLYAIVDVDVCASAGRQPVAVAVSCLAAGVRSLQIRAKHLGAADLLALITAVQPAATASGAALVVNDRVDVARAAGVGVHLGQHDLPVAAARGLVAPGALLGLSTHSLAQVDQALSLPVTYVAYGPVFATSTKLNPDPVVGLDGLAAAARRCAAAQMPLVAIGGITLDNAAAAIGAGATAVAVISDLLRGGDDPGARARRFLSVLSTNPV